MPLPAAFIERLSEVSRELSEVQKPIRVLRALAWPPEVREDFFARGARELPRATYEGPRFDVAATVRRLREITARISGDNDIERLLRDTCESYEIAAQLLASVGTRRFWALSCELYGRPQSVSCDGKTTNLALAEHFDRVIDHYAGQGLGLVEDKPELTALEVAEELQRRFDRFFVHHPIRVEVVDSLSANAVAGADVVKINRASGFSRRDVEQLAHHEGYVHVATTLNGRSQPLFSILGTGAPRTTRTQEGLAIFSEFISQTMDLERLRRLTDRILAIKMAEDGASFLELYRYFLEHGHAPTQAFECARRVCRGGLVEGGAPFTKDVVYLDGLIRVSNFLRVAITSGKLEYVQTLFVGKLDLSDIPIFAQLRREGVLAEPRYLPDWARDLPFLTAYMAYSAFLNQTDLDATHEYYEDIIARAEASLVTKAIA
ncbi:MAG: DUF1704 domain-containing protein [Deltaproteobacteria bacterium]|nr:DUF1704 domain-containing protein [Deltaproteobacteria bacterium]